MQLVARLTKDIVETYQVCNPQFKYSEELNPKRYLTTPSIGVLNDGYDNVNSDLILTVNYTLVNLETQRRFIPAYHFIFLIVFLLFVLFVFAPLVFWFSATWVAQQLMDPKLTFLNEG